MRKSNSDGKEIKLPKTKAEKKSQSDKRRFNSIDLLIILLIVACIGVLVVRYTLLDNVYTTRNLDEYEMTFTASSLSYAQSRAIFNALSEDTTDNDWVYFSDGVTKIGNVKMTNDFKQDREKVTFTKSDGSVVTVNYDKNASDDEVKWNIRATLSCRGRMTEKNEFLLNGKTYIAPNDEINVYLRDCDLTIRVVKISPALE